MSNNPDRLENSLRFGCGGIFGAGAGLIVWLQVLPLDSSAYTVLTCIVLLVAASGSLAVRFGDRYLETVSEWFR